MRGGKYVIASDMKVVVPENFLRVLVAVAAAADDLALLRSHPSMAEEMGIDPEQAERDVCELGAYWTALSVWTPEEVEPEPASLERHLFAWWNRDQEPSLYDTFHA